MVTATFVKNDDLFINVFHRETKMQYSFIYSVAKKEMITSIKNLEIAGKNILNFCLKSFFNPLTDEIYTFYRQG